MQQEKYMIKAPMSEKSEGMKLAIEQFLPGTIEALRENKCPVCKDPIVIADFVDLLSLREYEISGLCQKCQDKFFNPTGDDE